ncbi:MAG TPA: hypothetical protein VLY24_31615 [Bryobacteraceae bacterium]|nr:hypothetical protein [Bryobacteraceae bacterium]
MSTAEKYVREGHPTVEELATEQHLVFPRDLLGNFWPDEEPVDDFIKALRE